MTIRHEYFIKGEPLLAEPLHYTLCGLPNIYLLNGVILHEDDGYGPSFEIRDVDSLHDAIAAHIVFRVDSLMSGSELRFLRKRMRKTQAELAKQIKVNEQTIANYEKGATAINGPVDLAIRMIYMLHVLPPDAGKALLDAMARAIQDEVEMDDHLIHPQLIWDEARIAA